MSLLNGFPLILQIETFRNSRGGFRQVVEFGPKAFDASVEPLGFIAAGLLRHVQIGLQLRADWTLFRQQRLPKVVNLRVVVIGTIGAIDTGEDRLQAVVVRLLDWVELVIVAACAVDRQAGEGRHGRHHHVVPIEKPGNALVHRVFPKLRVSDKIPGTGGNEARGDNTLRVIGKQDVAGQLFFHENVRRVCRR